MKVVGLGSGGGRIADCFAAYEQYSVYKLGVGLKDTEFTKGFPALSSPEEYEEKCPDLSTFFSSVQEGDEVLFILVGGSDVTAATLRVLEIIKHAKITILYIRPDVSLLSQKKALHERVTSGVLQEYARSGLLERIYFADNLVLESIVGELPLAVYHNKLNQLLCSTMHMINVYKHTEPVMRTDGETTRISRISTLGMVDPKNGKENLFANLENTTMKFYYYSISKEVLERDGKLLTKIKNQVKENNPETVKAGFGIYENDYGESFGYVETHTHFVQQPKTP